MSDFHYDPETGERIDDPEESTENTVTADDTAATGDTVATDNIDSVDQAADAYDAGGADSAGTVPSDGSGAGASDVPTGKIIGYDPMTGEPVYESIGGSRRITGYDPMTGQPIYEPAEGERKIVGYDPMTGQPIYEGAEPGGAAPGAAPGGAGTPPARKPAGGKKPAVNGKLLIFAGVIVAAVVVICLIAVKLLSGRNAKFLKAIKKSYEPGKLVSALVDSFDPYSDYTVQLNALLDDTEFSGSLSNSNSKQQYSAEAALTMGRETAEAAMFMNNKKIILSSPSILDYPVVYDYSGDSDGYFAKENGDDLDLELSAINAAHGQKKYVKRAEKILKKAFNRLKFKKINSKKLTVNDKRVECKGYEAEVTADILADLVEELGDVVLDEAENTGCDRARMREIESSIDDYAKMVEDYEDSGDVIVVELYLCKGRIAAVEIVNDGRSSSSEIMSLRFEGGEYWMENMSLSLYGQDMLIVTGRSGKDKEKRSVTMRGAELFSYDYDPRSGDLEVDVPALGARVDANLERSGKNLTLKLEDASVDLGIAAFSLSSTFRDYDISLKLSKGASIKKISDKDAYDIGNMNEREYNDLLEEAGKNAADLIADISQIGDLIEGGLNAW